MRTPTRSILSFLFVFVFSAMSWTIQAQSNSGSISGTVTDPSQRRHSRPGLLPGLDPVPERPHRRRPHRLDEQLFHWAGWL